MDRRELVKRIRRELKNEKAILEILDKYNLDPSIIDHVSIKFEPLDVSAKTVDGHVILNERLLDGDWRDIVRYATHELTHVAQQTTSDIEKTQDLDYLDDPYEKEAFRTQRKVMEELYDPEEIQSYLEGLVDHHGLKGKERLRKIRELKR